MHTFPQILTVAASIAQTLGVPPATFYERVAAWQRAITEVGGGELVISNMVAEQYLSLEEKAQIMSLAVIGPSAPRIKVLDAHATLVEGPFRALERACLSFPDRGPSIGKACGDLSRYMAFSTANWRILPITGTYATYRGPSDDALKGALKLPSTQRDPELLRHLRGRVRGGADTHVFSTLASWADAIPSGNLPVRVRDGLALPHLDGHEIVELRFGEQTARNTGVFRKPTFADALGRPIFLPSAIADEYGYTRDLAAGLLVRGGPEVWHGPFRADLVTQVRAIGVPHTPMKTGCWTAYHRW